MWRKWGDYLYAVLVFAIFAIEAIALTALTLAFLGRIAGIVAYGGLFKVLFTVVVATGVALLVVTAHVLVYAALSAARDRTHAEKIRKWTELYSRWVVEPATPLPRKLSSEAEEALLDLRELLSGPESDALARHIVETGLAARLAKKARSHRLGPRLHALEGLAKARLPDTLDTAYELLREKSPLVVRCMAARVIARTLAVLHDPDILREQARRFTDVLVSAALPIGVVNEALLLLDDAVKVVVPDVLDHPSVSVQVACAALNVAGRTGLREIAPRLVTLGVHSHAEVRAHALETAERLGSAVPGLDRAIVDGNHDKVDFVRLHAVRALPLLGPETALDLLPSQLADTCWHVRRAAAETLMSLGWRGAKKLEEARAGHADRYARAMARSVLTNRTLQETP